MNITIFTLKLFYNILHYQQNKKSTIFYYNISTKNLLYPHFLYKNLVFSLQKFY